MLMAYSQPLEHVTDDMPPIKKLYVYMRRRDIESFTETLKLVKDINEVPDGEGVPIIELALRRTDFEFVPLIYACPSLDFDGLHKIKSIYVLNETVRMCKDVEIVKKVASDVRIGCNRYNESCFNPLELAIAYGYHDMAKWIMYLRHQDIDGLDPLCYTMETQDQDLFFGGKEIFDTFQELKIDPVNTKFKLGLELLIPEVLASLLYATVIFHCDGLLNIKEEYPPAGWFLSSRFYSVASKLPMELQMVLCNRVYGVPKDNIPSAVSEPAFKHLARVFGVMETKS